MRVAVQLVQARSDKNLWGSSYERDLGEVFALQSEMARAIAGQVRVALTPQERTHLAASRRVSPEAHEEYLKGRYALGRFSDAGFRGALEHFRRAVENDPGFALAHVGVADAYSMLSTLSLPPVEAMPKARAAAERALALDPDLPEALAARANVGAFHSWDWPAAEVGLRRAIALNPGNSVARFQYGAMLVCLGRFDEAARELELQRTGGMDAYGAAVVYGVLGMRDEAFAELEREMAARRETVTYLKVDPQMDPLRSDPRFGVLLRRLGFAS